MKLTPLDIHHKEFRRAIRGYNEEEVDVFLDQVAAEFERVFKENIDQKEQLEKTTEQLKQYEGIEQTLQKALLTAQQAADEVQNNAQKESDLIVKDAELKAKEIIQQILSEKQVLQGNLGTLKTAENDFRDNFRAMLNDYLNNIEKVERGEEPVFNEEAFSSAVEQVDPEERLAEPESDSAGEGKTEFEQKQEDDVQSRIEAKRAEIEAQQTEIEAKKAEEEAKSAEEEAHRHETEDKEARIEADAQENDGGSKESTLETPAAPQNDGAQTDGGRPSLGYKISEHDEPAQHPDLDRPPKSGMDWIKPAREWPSGNQEESQKKEDTRPGSEEVGFKVTLGQPETVSKDQEPPVDTRAETPIDDRGQNPVSAGETIHEFEPEPSKLEPEPSKPEPEPEPLNPSDPTDVAQSVSSFFDDDLGVDEEEKNSDIGENSSDNKPVV